MKMPARKSNMVLRLVDVVLILLFGFLMIAKIQMQVDITLPQSEGDNAAVESESKTFDVVIYKNGMVALGRNQDIRIKLPLLENLNGDRRAKYKTLKSTISKLNPQKKTVVIQTEYDAPVQYTVHLLDICKELDMGKSIRCNEAPLPGIESGGK